MSFKHNQKTTKVGGDRLSNLSDDLIHKIFSSISTKLLVETSVLSSRWRFIWTSMPCLNLSSQDFDTLPKFSKFVTRVLSRRNSEIEVSSVKLSFRGKLSQGFVKKFMDYAFSHNIQRLDLSYLLPDSSSEFPLSLLSFPSLKYLNLSNGKSLKYLSLSNGVHYMRRLKITSSFELPALTTLYLDDVNFDDYDGLVSKCANLKNLTLKNCGMMESENFSIRHPRLSNLTLDNSFMGKFVIVVAPKLENLTIRNCDINKYAIRISAPDLISFVYKGDYYSLSLSTDGFNSLKKADIYVSKPKYEHSCHIIRLLQHLHNVKILVLNLGIVELLSSCMELVLHQPFVFTNLMRLKICPQSVSSQGEAPNKSYIFVDSSPGATLEEIVVQSIMVELWVLLEQEKTNTKTNMTRMERGKDPMESHDAKMPEIWLSQAKTKLQIGKSVTAKIESCLEHLRVQIDERKSKYCLIMSKLQKIEEVLAKVSPSKRASIQPGLASMYAEVFIVMGGITDLMKTRCDENESRISVCVQELATTFKPSY